MNQKKQCEKIKKERFKEYGDFKTNMLLIEKIKKGIHISKQSPKEAFATSREFIINILALKATRSLLSAKDSKAYEDTILDFINYYNLFVETYKTIILFDKSIFNKDLNFCLANKAEITELLSGEFIENYKNT